MKQHTPGPWRIVEFADSGIFVSPPDDNISVICDIVTRSQELGNDDPSDEDRANAALIAAAPELLEALRRIFKMSLDVTIKDIARAAIEKAEGAK